MIIDLSGRTNIFLHWVSVNVFDICTCVNYFCLCILFIVGLPARGKSFLSGKIVSYFNWSGINSKVFNAGTKRRDVEGASKSGRSEFFNSTNSVAVSKRDVIALSTLDDAVHWLLNENGTIAIFDATNTTQARRSLIQQHLNSKSCPVNLIFIESICNNEKILNNNFLQKVRNSPDFKGMEETKAVEDLKARIVAYEKVYEPVEDVENFPYIKVIDLANKVICFRIFGSIPSKCVQLLMSCHVGMRPLFLVRAGHCNEVDDFSLKSLCTSRASFNGNCVINFAQGPYANPPIHSSTPTPSDAGDCTPSRESSSSGGSDHFKMPSALTSNAQLSASGREFAARCGKYVANRCKNEDIVVFTSTLPRAIETAEALKQHSEFRSIASEEWSSLGMLDTGICHGLSVKHIREHMQNEYSLWQADCFNYRFPGGESILDMNKRLSEVVLEIERVNKPLIVVSHLTTIQSLVAYFTSRVPTAIPLINIPRHSVIVLLPSIYGWSMETIHESKLPAL